LFTKLYEAPGGTRKRIVNLRALVFAGSAPILLIVYPSTTRSISAAVVVVVTSDMVAATSVHLVALGVTDPIPEPRFVNVKSRVLLAAVEPLVSKSNHF
jgi:hypothetical protein